jgi:zinc protease
MAELEAASLGDVKSWLESWYGAANAVVVLAGDVDAATAREKMARYVGDLSPGPPVPRAAPRVDQLSGSRWETLRGRFPAPRLYLVWNVPGLGSADADYLELASAILGRGKSSRLARALPVTGAAGATAAPAATAAATAPAEPMATAESEDRGRAGDDLRAAVFAGELGGQFQIEIGLPTPGEARPVAAVVRAELARFGREGPSAAELARAKAQYTADLVRSMDRPVGAGSLSDRLARGEAFAGKADAYLDSLRRIESATREDLRSAAERWLAEGALVLAALPLGVQAEAAAADRAPAPGTAALLAFPALHRSTLGNGLKVIVAERHELPVVDLWMVFDAGSAADPPTLSGAAAMTAALLAAGTASRSSRQIAEELAGLGAELTVRSGYDANVIGLSAVKWNLEPSAALLADLVAHPTFPAAQLARQRDLQIAELRRAAGAPLAAALHALEDATRGPGAGCGDRFTSGGSADGIGRLQRQDVVDFHAAWFRPNNATLVVAGDATPAEIEPLLGKLLARWEQRQPPRKACGGPELPARSRIAFVDRPGSRQTFVLAATGGPPGRAVEDLPLELLADALAGNKSSRLNLSLREEKHWSYGIGSFIWKSGDRRLLVAYGAVERDKAKDAMLEIGRELRAVAGERTPAGEELAAVKTHRAARLASSLLTLDGLARSIADLVVAGLPDGYYGSWAERLAALSPDDLRQAVRTLVDPDKILWVVVGDRAAVEPGLRASALPEIAEPAPAASTPGRR